MNAVHFSDTFWWDHRLWIDQERRKFSSPCCELSTGRGQRHRAFPPEEVWWNLISFEVVWWIEKIIFQQLYRYLLFNCLSILNGLLEMPGSCCKFWSHLCFQVQSHLAHSLQPKKCSMKPCIAFSTSLGKKSILHSCKAGLTFKQAQEQWAPISNHQELFETLDLQHELLPGWWSESARDSTNHRGNHHTWPSDRNEYVKRHIYFISTIRILISILIIIFISILIRLVFWL